MKPLNIPIPDALKVRLDKYSKDNGIHKKKIVELALEEYLNKSEFLYPKDKGFCATR